jgi:hypothetical protein
MNTEINGPRNGTSTTDDHLAGASQPASMPIEPDRAVFAVNTDGIVKTTSDKSLDPLFTVDAATDFRSRWDVVQRSFVDDPQEAVRAADDLVAQVTKSLEETFSNQRAALEGELNQTERASTENLRLALRSYRAFFERLLSI